MLITPPYLPSKLNTAPYTFHRGKSITASVFFFLNEPPRGKPRGIKPDSRMTGLFYHIIIDKSRTLLKISSLRLFQN
jgi:hypothetical protein